jgi:hypothetical protein
MNRSRLAIVLFFGLGLAGVAAGFVCAIVASVFGYVPGWLSWVPMALIMAWGVSILFLLLRIAVDPL